MRKYEEKYGNERNLLNILWSMQLSKKEDHYSFGILSEFGKCKKWSVDMEIEIRLIGKQVLSTKGINCHIDSIVYWRELMTIKTSQIDKYLIDGNSAVEFHVKILKLEEVKEVKSKFLELMNKDSDVVLVVDGEKFLLSKAFLASRSPYFKSLLMENSKGLNQSEVVLQGIEAYDFQNFLEILHAGRAIDDENVESVLRVADMYDTNCVVKQAEEFLLKLSKKSRKEKSELAVKYNLKYLKESIPPRDTEIRSLLPDNLSQLNTRNMAELFKRYLSATTTTTRFPITVKTLNDKQFEVYVYSTETIVSLKSKIEEKEGIPAQQQRIIFDGQQLKDGKTLGDYDVKRDSIVHLVWFFFPTDHTTVDKS